MSGLENLTIAVTGDAARIGEQTVIRLYAMGALLRHQQQTDFLWTDGASLLDWGLGSANLCDADSTS